MFWWIVIGILVVASLLYDRWDATQITERPLYVNKRRLANLINSTGAEGIRFMSHNYSGGAILSEKEEKLYIFYSNGGVNEERSYGSFTCDFADIIESEVVVDSHTITKTARGSQIVGAAVGGVLLGGVGAIIGGLSGSKDSFDQVKEMDIKLTINDLNSPIHKINFLDGKDEEYKIMKKGFHKDSPEYKRAFKSMEKWQGMFDIILNNREE